jgi:3-hydroxybutyryl-CoA dehydrogenase
MSSIQKVAIVGAGTMGLGIAQVAAMAGHDVILYDISEDVLARALRRIQLNLDKGIEKGKITEEQKTGALKNITGTIKANELIADLVIEAVVEDLEVKKEVFDKLERINEDSCILATNTSSIPITRIASHMDRPDRFLGIHFFNPAHIMKLVEVISGEATDKKVAEEVMRFVTAIGKVAVPANDSPGFIVNRVARHFYVESLKLLEENVATVETIDQLMEASGFRMGPFRLMDLIGVDTNFSVTKTMYESFHMDPKFRPSRIQQQKVDAGYHGVKSGRGFYDYS